MQLSFLSLSEGLVLCCRHLRPPLRVTLSSIAAGLLLSCRLALLSLGAHPHLCHVSPKHVHICFWWCWRFVLLQQDGMKQHICRL